MQNIRWMSKWLLIGLAYVLFLGVLSSCSGLISTREPTPFPPTSSSTGVSPLTNLGENSASATPDSAQNINTKTASPTTGDLASTDTPLPTSHGITFFPDPKEFMWQNVASGFLNPVGIVNAADQSKRLFILEQSGLVRILERDVVSELPYLDIRSKVSCCGERGLLGLAFHPEYVDTGTIYVNYTDVDGDTVIARFSTAADNPAQIDIASEHILLNISQPYGNHNGGGMAFGPDGFLYIGLGDGGSANDPHGNAQNTNTLLGKILRLDVNEGEHYAIPQDNPFVVSGGLSEIWAYGLRNPWRFTFDSLTGDLYIGDVGQNTWEEIDFWSVMALPGANFGWNFREGKHEFNGDPPIDLQFVDPVAEYAHDQGCSVTGGVVYRGNSLPEWNGIYLYGDYCSGKIWGLLSTGNGVWQTKLLFETGLNITAFGQDEAGEVYLVDYSGSLYQLVHVR